MFGSLAFENRIDGKENATTPVSRQKLHSSLTPNIAKPQRRVLGDLSNASVQQTSLKSNQKITQKAQTKQTTKIFKAIERPDIELTHTSPFPEPGPSISYLDNLDVKIFSKPLTSFPVTNIGSKKLKEANKKIQPEEFNFDDEAFLDIITTTDASSLLDEEVGSFDFSVQLPELE